jgi:glucokinase
MIAEVPDMQNSSTEPSTLASPFPAQDKTLHAPALGRRVANQQLVARILHQMQVATIPALSKRTQLSIPTVHRVLAALASAGLVQEVPSSYAAVSKGRPPTSYALTWRNSLIAVADIGNGSTRWATVTGQGTLMSRGEAATSSLADDLDDNLLRILRASALSTNPRARIVGVVLGFAAAVDPRSGTIVSAPVFHEWVGLPLRTNLSAALKCPVLLFQDDHLAAWGERTTRRIPDASTVVAVNIGQGIGVGWAGSDGPTQGDHGMAGRVVAWPITIPRIPVSRLGDILTAAGLLSTYKFLADRTHCSDPATSVPDLADQAIRGNLAAREVFTLAGRVLAELIQRVSTLLDPSLVVLGGGLSNARQLLEPSLQRTLTQITPPTRPIPLTWTTLGDTAVLTGAAHWGNRLFSSWLDKQILDLRPPNHIS